jgi:NDP-sugar pyrophosphorylase family protein
MKPHDCPYEMVILAGGENTRMEALRGTIYKAFLPIHGLSCVARHIIRAAVFGIMRVDIIVDVQDPALAILANSAEDEISRKGCMPKVRILAHPGSPADKILWWRDQYGSNSKVLVVVGDTLAPVDLRELWCKADSDGFDSAIAVAEVSLPFGVVEVDEDSVRCFRDNPPTGLLVNTGHMVLGPRSMRLMESGSDLGSLLGILAVDGVLRALVCDGLLTAVDSLGGLASAHITLAKPVLPR